MISKKTGTYKFVLTLTDFYSIVNNQFIELSFYSHMNAQTMTVCAMLIPPELNSVLHSHLVVMMRTDGIKVPNQGSQAEKGHSPISQAMTS